MSHISLVFLLTLLLTGGAVAGPLARVKVPLCPVTLIANEKSEQVTQVMLWDEVEVLSTQGMWANVLVRDQYRTEKGYPGWMKLDGLEMKPRPVPAGSRWMASSYPQIILRSKAETTAPIVMRIWMSTRLPVATRSPVRDAKGQTWYTVAFPDGGKAWVRANQVQNEVEPALVNGFEVVEQACRLENTPYLWGGMSRTGIDCSGLTYVAYRMNGVTIPRDADQQYQVGEAVLPDELIAGDLVFFGEPGDISHVGMYVGKGTFVHASSGAGVMVSPLFEGWYKQYYRGARRILRTSAGGTRVLTPAP